MSDLAARIREHIRTRLVDGDPLGVYVPAVEEVLDLHKPDRGNGPDPDGRCFECAEVSPCPTVRALAGALGVLEDKEI